MTAIRSVLARALLACGVALAAASAYAADPAAPAVPVARYVERNRLLRCEVHPTAADREECIRRMTQGTVRGSVEGGGVVRELVTRVPAE